jgi:thiol-disulfide isomerase/thioredoxin
MKKIILPALAALAAFTFNINASTLGIGDPAPTLKVSKWVKGGAVDGLDSNKTYVVEFWATWCGPCRESIPHLTEMAHKYPNVTFIGVDVAERGAHIESNVKKFVRKMGRKMDYHVAMDTEENFMVENWLKVVDMQGIPIAFLVHQGEIVWIGRPMGGLDETLTEVTAGKVDIEKAKKRAAAQKKVDAFYNKAMHGGDAADLLEEGKELEALDKELGGITPGKPFNTEETLKSAKFESLVVAYQRAFLAGKDEAQVAKLEAAARAAAPKDENFDEINVKLHQIKDNQKAAGLFNKYLNAVGEDGDKEKAADLAKKIEALNLKDTDTLDNMATTILTDENIKERDFSLATRFAKAGVDASEGKDFTAYDVYARALFESGNMSEAIEAEKKAIALCEDNGGKSEFEAKLKKYQAAADKTKGEANTK